MLHIKLLFVVSLQAESLLPNNGSSFNVTEVAFVASSISGQRVVFFVIEFSENTTLEENFITTIKNDTVNLIEAVIPSGMAQYCTKWTRTCVKALVYSSVCDKSFM